MKSRLFILLGCLLIAIGIQAENTKTINVTFADFPKGVESATNEKHDLGNGLVIYTTNCFFTSELRMYPFPNKGYAVSESLPGTITKIALTAGHAEGKNGDLEIHGSIDGVSWDLIKTISTTKEYTSATSYSIAFPESSTYCYFKISLASYFQQRIISMDITYIGSDNEDNEDSGDNGDDGGTDPEPPVSGDDTEQPSEPNNGTESKPYTVEDIKGMSYSTKTNIYIKGVIYGTIDNSLQTSDFVNTNIVIGDATAYVLIQLPSGNIRNEINLKDHPYLKGKEILIKGNFGLYYGVLGLTSPTQYKITYDIPINRYGYASLCLDMPASVPTGTTAYYCTTEGNRANLLPVGDIIPANVGVIIEGEPNTTCTLTYTTEGNVDETIIRSNNQLIGFAEDTDIEADGNAYYALNAKDDNVGFYIPQTAVDATDATKGFKAKAYKAYLKVPANQQATMFVIHRENGETDIVPVMHTSDDLLYDMQGRIVTSPGTGLYILNGKKILINNK